MCVGCSLRYGQYVIGPRVDDMRRVRLVHRVRMLLAAIRSLTCCRGRATPTVMTRAAIRPTPLPAVAAIMPLTTRARTVVTTRLRTRAWATAQAPAPPLAPRQATPHGATELRPVKAQPTAPSIAKGRLQQRLWGGSQRWRRVRSSAAQSAITATGALRRSAGATVAE